MIEGYRMHRRFGWAAPFIVLAVAVSTIGIFGGSVWLGYELDYRGFEPARCRNLPAAANREKVLSLCGEPSNIGPAGEWPHIGERWFYRPSRQAILLSGATITFDEFGRVVKADFSFRP